MLSTLFGFTMVVCMLQHAHSYWYAGATFRIQSRCASSSCVQGISVPGSHTHTARAKSKWGFTLKNHKERTIPIPAELVKLLNEHRQTADPDCTVLFPNTKGSPNGHFLRYLRAAAKRAGLNCGHCVGVIAGKSHTCELGRTANSSSCTISARLKAAPPWGFAQ
jgi:hypothetical protein